jgi:hypothetical protein
MSSILDSYDAPAKIMLIGKSGAGKTGALASLVAAGYRLRIIDTDKGVRPLRSLLTDPRYKYAEVIKNKNIDLNNAVRFVQVDTRMSFKPVDRNVGGKITRENILAPVDANAWPTVVNLLSRWKEGDVDLGSPATWTGEDVLVLDSFSTLAKCAYYFSQQLNGRLGARDEGYDYQRDIGAAQAQLRRLLELLYDSNIKCSVIVITHIVWVDESRGVAERPKTPNDAGGAGFSNPDGLPSAIGRALSPDMGKYFNDMYVVRASGSGSSVQRRICTVPTDGVSAKNSVYLNREYGVETGLAEIFSALREVPPPADLINVFRPQATPSVRP